MANTWHIALSVPLALFLVACGGSSSDTQTSTNTSENNPTSEKPRILQATNDLTIKKFENGEAKIQIDQYRGAQSYKMRIQSSNIARESIINFNDEKVCKVIDSNTKECDIKVPDGIDSTKAFDYEIKGLDKALSYSFYLQVCAQDQCSERGTRVDNPKISNQAPQAVGDTVVTFSNLANNSRRYIQLDKIFTIQITGVGVKNEYNFELKEKNKDELLQISKDKTITNSKVVYTITPNEKFKYDTNYTLSVSSDEGKITADFSTKKPSLVKKTGAKDSYDENGTKITDGSLKDDAYYSNINIGVDREFVRDDSEQVVKDVKANLIWQDDIEAKNVVKKYTTSLFPDKIGFHHNSVQEYCKNLQLNGGGWRVPTVQEFMGIIDYSQENSSTIDKAFKNVSEAENAENYWTSTIDRNSIANSNHAWVANFATGIIDILDTNFELRVRCVKESK